MKNRPLRDLNRPVPTPARWVARTLGWGVAALVFVALFVSFSRFDGGRAVEDCQAEERRPGAARSPLDRARAMSACLDRQAGAAGRLAVRSHGELLGRLPATPCRYVGIWVATRPNAAYQITLTDDSRFVAEPRADLNPDGGPSTGMWGVVDGQMVWLYDSGRVWPPDINPIRDITGLGFTLVEANGSSTRFVLVRNLPSTTCSR